MRSQRQSLPALLLALALAACTSGGHSDDCGDIPPAAPPYAPVTKVSGTPFAGQILFDIPAQRSAGTPTVLVLEYSVQRPSQGWCGGSYLGPLSPRYISLAQGITASFAPTTLPAVQTPLDIQTLIATLTIAPTVPDGHVALSLVSPEVLPPYRPTYTLVLSTMP